MYHSFIIYIIIILAYSIQVPPEAPPFSWSQTIFLQAILYLLFALATRIRFAAIIRRRHRELLNLEQLPAAYDRGVTQLNILAVAAYLLSVYALNIKSVITNLPLAAHSSALNNLIAFAVFLLYQLIIWAQAHKKFSPLLVFERQRSTYCSRKLFFALGIIAPWLAIMGITDAIQCIAPDFYQHLLQSALIDISLFAVFLLLLSAIAPPLMVKLWGCRPMPPSALRASLADFCAREGVRYREILLWPSVEGRMATAAVIGPYFFSRYLLITPGLIEMLNPEEIKAVMAHEIGHVKRRHLLVFLLFFLSIFLLNYAFFELLIGWLLTTNLIQGLLLSFPHQQANILSLASTIPLLLIYLLYFRFVFGYFLRNFEREADLYALTALGTAEPLISAFRKLAFLIGDYGQRSNWHHYNIPQRIDYLLKCSANPALINKHRRKLKTGLALFLLCVTSLVLAGSRLNTTEMRQSLNNRFLIKVMENYRREHPGEVNACISLGSLYFEEKKLREAQECFEAALKLDRHRPELLNNYAWLLLTADDPRIQDIERGFRLAKEAAAINPVPHILDTLAEGYWRRGFPCVALDLEQKVLAAKPKQREIYQRQAEKFARDCHSKKGGGSNLYR
ncbi:MAG: hypothetical protein DRH04_04090 [Deltaproteobacteria bacterium]|nr:MAG: hypothetical protein DRH04_04090 [Deltaproteobacteria bacterium]